MIILSWCPEVDSGRGEGDRSIFEKEDDSVDSYPTEDRTGMGGGGGTRGFSGTNGGVEDVTEDVSRRLVSIWTTKDSRSFVLDRTKSSTFSWRTFTSSPSCL